jgi:acetate kinase
MCTEICIPYLSKHLSKQISKVERTCSLERTFMNILALNCGSSSIKYQVYNWTQREVLATGLMERIGSTETTLKHQSSNATEPIRRTFACANHEEAVGIVLEVVFENLPIGTRIDAVGHRVVHGGSRFARSVSLTPEVISVIEELSPLAPLHNPSNLAGIRAIERLLPTVPQVAVFDTAFHQTMPAEAYTYAVPKEWREKYGVRRYGFHGTSHLYVSRKVATLLGREPETLRVITCHIGNGASISAVKGGRTIDTSMGLTPMEGAIMGTRCGDLDLGIVPHLAACSGQSYDQIFSTLNKKSGMLGLTGYGDLRDVESDHKLGDADCTAALRANAYRIKKYIGAYAAAMNGVDVIVFTAGVGQNSSLIRRLALEEMGYLGVFIENELNDGMIRGKEGLISAKHSPVKVAVIATDEEQVIIEDTAALLSDRQPSDPNFRYSFQESRALWGEQAPVVGLHYANLLTHGYHEFPIPMAVSNRHIHLSREHVETLFGAGYKLNESKPLVQPGQYAAMETLTLVGPKGRIEKVRVLGPERKATQVEVSQTDAIKLGISAPVRDSGDLQNSAEIMLKGPKGEVTIKEGVILAVRHVHFHTSDAERFGIKDRDHVRVRTNGVRPVVFDNVLARVSDQFALEMHIDTDEANAGLIRNGDVATLCID